LRRESAGISGGRRCGQRRKPLVELARNSARGLFFVCGCGRGRGC